jgi:filamentous hemagglutinin family protein
MKRTLTQTPGRRALAKSRLFGAPSSHAIALMVPAMLLAAAPAFAAGGPILPSGGNFVAGAGTIGGGGPNLTVTQQTQRAVIDWKSFSIGQGGTVQFNNGAGATLSRVTGGDLSSILGTLKATGSLYLVNPNGVVVGSSGVVVTNGTFVASTLDVANNAFMAGATLVFRGTSNASVKNLGAISSSGGDVLLIAHDVTNAGTIGAPKGTAGLAAGQEVLVQDSADAHVFVQAAGGDVTNSGTIDAAQAELKAAGGNVYALAGTSGVIRATGTAVKNGEVWLTASGGDVEVSGTVSAQNANGSGGKIAVGDRSTAKTEIADGAVLDASAKAAKGNGGAVKVLGQVTNLEGTIKARGGKASGDGGTVETSGDTLSVAGGAVDAGAAKGKNGSWLLDPTDITIDSASAATIATSLSGGTDVTVTTTASGASGPGVQSPGMGNINVASAIASTGAGNLTLSAYNDINIGAGIDTHTGALTLKANNSGTVAGTTVLETASGSVKAASLAILGAGSRVALLNSENAVSVLAANTDSGGAAGGSVTFANSTSFAIGSVTAGGTTISGLTTKTLTLYDAGLVTQSQGAIVTASDVLLEGGVFDLDQLNLIGTVAASAAGIGVTDAEGMTLTIGTEIDPVTSNPVAGIISTGGAGTLSGVGLQADKMVFAAGISAPGQPVLLETTTSGLPIDIGSGNDGLLIPTNLQITAAALLIGGDGGIHAPHTVAAGTITVNGAVNFANVGALGLVSTGDITEPLGGSITSPALAVVGANIALTQQNTVASIAMGATKVGTGSIGFNDTEGFSITTVGLSGVLSGSGLSADGAIHLLSLGSVTQTAPITTATGTAPSLALVGANTAAGGVNFSLTNTGNTVGTLAVVSDGNVSLTDSISMTIGSVAGVGTFGPTVGVSANRLTLTDAGTVSQTQGITADQLELLGAGGQYQLTGANQVGTVAAHTGSLNLFDYVTLSVGTAGGTSNITTTGPITLTAEKMVLGGGTITASGQTVQLVPLLNSEPVTLGTGGTEFDLTAADLNTVTAGSLVIGGTNSGNITINQAIAPAHVGSLGLLSNGGVNQTAGSTISVANLGINAFGITLDEANAVGTVALNALAGVSFVASGDLTVGTVTIPSNLTGVGAGVGTAKVVSGGNLTLNGAVSGDGSGDAVVLAAAGNFINNVGTAAIAVQGGGRFLIFSTDPVDNVSGGLNAAPLYNDSFNFTTDSYAPVTNSGNRFVYSYAPKLTVTPNSLTKTYNGATQSSNGFSTVSGFVNGDNPNLAVSGTAAVAGSGHNAGGYTLTASLGSLASDYGYGFAFAPGTLTITQAPLTIQASTTFKTYDGTTAATQAPLVTGTVYAGDTGAFSEAFASKDVVGSGVGQSVIVSGIVNDGNGGNNYSYNYVNGNVGTMARRTVTISGTRTYDGTTGVAAGALSLSNTVMGDSLSLASGSVTIAAKNAGSEAITAFNGLSLAGANANDYALPSSASGFVTINPAAITVTAAANTKTYDGTAVASATPTVTSGAIFSGDSAFFTESYATANAGTGLALTPAGTVNDGNGGANYAVTFAPVATGEIDRRVVTLSGTRVYDGTANASASILTVTDDVDGGKLTISGTGILTGQHQGNDALAGAGTLTLGGSAAANYTLTGATGTVAVTPLAVVLTGGRVYDGSTGAASTILTVANAIGGDTVKVASGSGVLASKTVGSESIAGFGTLAFANNSYGDYTLTGATGSVNITPAVLTAGLTGTVGKTYDGTVNAALSAANYTLSGVVVGDAVALNDPTAGSFNNANAGNGKTVSVNGLAIGGADGGNYTLLSTVASANIGLISPKSITYAVADASSTFGIAPVLGAASLTGIVPGDGVTGTVGLFNGPNSVAANAATPVGFFTEKVVALGGAGAGNYAVTDTGSTPGTLTVNAAQVTPQQLTPQQIGNPSVTPPISQTIAQASLQLQLFGATSFVVSNGASVTATLSSSGGAQVLTVNTIVNNVPVSYVLPVAAQNGEGGGGLLASYSSFDDLLAAAQTTQNASN